MTLGFNHDFLAEISVTSAGYIWIGAPILGSNDEHSTQFNYSIYYTDPAHEHILKSFFLSSSPLLPQVSEFATQLKTVFLACRRVPRLHN